MKCETCSKEIKKKIVIKHRNSGRVMLEKNTLIGADLHGADLIGANLSEADLREADLREADLFGADLSGADLSGADLREANLSKADLSGANLLFCKMEKKVFKEITEGWFEWEVVRI